jgi:hypothetical protein
MLNDMNNPRCRRSDWLCHPNAFLTATAPIPYNHRQILTL